MRLLFVRRVFLCALALLLFFLAGCTSDTPAAPPASAITSETAEQPVKRDPTAHVYVPEASGTTVWQNEWVEIDGSHTDQGYVMVRYLGGEGKIKMQLTCEGYSTYTYNLSPSGEYETFPLSCGDGSYTLNVFKNISGTSYAQLYGTTFEVHLADEFLPFLYPNQYVNFSAQSQAVALGEELAGSAQSDLEVVEQIYNYVITNITYDYDKMENVPSHYLPDVDEVLQSRRGICFDYAALMTCMLRSQRIPTRLVVGYAGTAYHAWISVYLDDIGWVDGIIQFDGVSWVRMDPTFAATNNGSKDILAYIGDGKNYQDMYVY